MVPEVAAALARSRQGYEERHANPLENPEERDAFAATMAEALDATAKRLHALAEEIRQGSARAAAIIGHAFLPNITGMHPSAVAQIEATYFGENPPKHPRFGTPPVIEIRTTLPMGGPLPRREICARVLVLKDEMLVSQPDNRHG